jgi:hypothetical protein
VFNSCLRHCLLSLHVCLCMQTHWWLILLLLRSQSVSTPVSDTHVLHCLLSLHVCLCMQTRIKQLNTGGNVVMSVICFVIHMFFSRSQDSSVDIVMRCGLGSQGSPTGLGKRLSLLHSGQSSHEAHPASYSVGTRGSFPMDKAAGAWSYHSPPSSAELKNSGAIPPLPQTYSWHGA